jgi:nitrile hydratase subunit beta
MNGPHDLGGQMGFGQIPLEANEPVFHAKWEKRALGITLCCDYLGAWTIDESRYALECIPPAEYLSGSYFQNWIRGLETLLVGRSLVSPGELRSGRPESRDPQKLDVLTPDQVPNLLASGPSERPPTAQPRFSPGDRVKTRNIHPTTHTRLPRYARGKPAVVEMVQGFYIFPDDNAHGRGENPQWLYTIVFQAEDLWGTAADRYLTVSIDAWENYLEQY